MGPADDRMGKGTSLVFAVCVEVLLGGPPSQGGGGLPSAQCHGVPPRGYFGSLLRALTVGSRATAVPPPYSCREGP